MARVEKPGLRRRMRRPKLGLERWCRAEEAVLVAIELLGLLDAAEIASGFAGGLRRFGVHAFA